MLWSSLELIDAPRRGGDPARLIADASLAQRVLGRTPHVADIATIVRHAWRWETKMASSTS